MEKNKNLILIRYSHLNGSLIDAIEYFLFLKSIGSNTDLIVFDIYNKKPQKLIKLLIQDRYNIDFKYNIIYENKISDIVKYTCDNAMIIDHGTFNTLPLAFKFKHLYLWYEYENEITHKKYIDIDNKFKNVTVLNDMPFGYGEHYNFKLATTLFKKITNSKKVSLYNGLTRGIQDLNKIESVAKYALQIRYNTHIPGYDVILEHPKNYWESFSELIYYNNTYFDPRPRCFHECMFYKKEVYYYNDKKDGSYYRYNDKLTRELTETDYLIQVFK